MPYKLGETMWSEKMTAEELSTNRRTPFGDNVGANLALAGAILSLLPKPPLYVLDAGCADGWLSHFLELQGYKTCGIDVCSSEIIWAKDHHVNWRGWITDPNFIEFDFDGIKDMKFEAIVFANSLHHSIDRFATLYAAYNALLPGGTLIACEPGLGHGISKVSREWSKQMDVTERSCSPISIIPFGWEVGFKNIKVYPNPITLHNSIYHSGGHIRENAFARFFRRIPFSTLILTSCKWLHGITVMKKPKEVSNHVAI